MISVMPTFTHKDIAIEFTASGQFMAQLNGKYVSKGSLDAMKKAIDAAALSQIKPFTALRARNHRDDKKDDDYIRVTVTSIGKSEKSRYRRSTLQFIYDGGSNYSLYEDTLANIAALKAVDDYGAETERIAAERLKQYDYLQSKIVILDVDTYKGKP